MRRPVKILLTLAGLGFGLLIGAIYLTLPHWLVRVGFAEARGPGEAVSKVSIYKSTSGDIVFLTPEADCYVFATARNQISIPSCPSQLYSFGIVAFSIDSPIPGVSSSNRVKVETDMHVLINDEAVEFTTLSGRRVRATRESF
ncbi:MAG: hypothetical protein ABIR33_06120 [Pyrinomonadaceae bacterium]